MEPTKMEYSIAPLEGITYPEYRLLHHRMFPGADRYYAPFIAPGEGRMRRTYLEKRLPDIQQCAGLVPQILANDAERFMELARMIHDMGYDEVNLNVGCPSGTVFAKHKGSGMLRDLSSLERFLDGIFSAPGLKISIKTRMGVESTEEFDSILDLYNRYPLSCLTIHARTREDYYSGKPDLEKYARAAEKSRAEVCYNGNIFLEEDLDNLLDISPETRRVMLGRGVIANPALLRMLSGGPALTEKEFSEFHNTLLENYLSSGLDERTAVNRMKELWFYMMSLYPESERAVKKMMKANSLRNYADAVGMIMDTYEFDGTAGFHNMHQK